MSAEVVETVGNLVKIRVSGTMSPSDQTQLQKSLAKYLEQHDQVRVLILADQFDGWEKTDAWGNLSISFPIRFDSQIKAMAVVAEEKWDEQIPMFLGAGYRGFPIRRFHPEELEQAKQWIESDT